MNSISLKYIRRPENIRNDYAVMNRLRNSAAKFSICGGLPELPYGGPEGFRGNMSSLRTGD